MAQLVRIGNSKGIRIPKTLVEQARLEGKKLHFRLVEDGLLVSPANTPRQGWKEAIGHELRKHRTEPIDHEWLNASLTSDDEWEW